MPARLLHTVPNAIGEAVMVGSQPDKAFLADANPHYVARPETVVDLRARILLHTLLCDYLVIGDSQSLNNPLLRSIVADETDDRATPRDLARLFEAGRLRIARRNNRESLSAVRADHASRRVKDVPSDAYATLLDTLTARHLITYSGDDVTASFKSNVVELLGEGIDGAERDFADTLSRAQDWAVHEEVLLYHEIRDWSKQQPTDSPGQRQALARLESIASVAYQTALPDALGLDIAAPRSVLGLAGDLASSGAVAEVIVPPVMLVPFVIGRLPVDVVLEALGHPSRSTMVVQLDLIRQDLEFDHDALFSALQDFSDSLTRSALTALEQAHDDAALRVLHAQELRTRFRIDAVSSDQHPRARLDVIDVRDGHRVDGTLKILTMPTPGFADRPEKPPTGADITLDPEDRLIAVV
jgi:hypothetical protein